MKAIRLVCVIGTAESDMLPHLVTHYRAAGVTSFYLIRHAESTADPRYPLAEEYARQAGLRLFHTYVGPWGLEVHSRLVRYAMDEHPEDWYVIADTDEFQVYDRPLADLVEYSDRCGHDHVNGCFVDRISADGDFPDPGGGSLWLRYPLAGSISAALVRALPIKVCLARGHLPLLTAQHGTPEGRAAEDPEGYVQIHHFKWTGGVLERLRARVSRFETGQWEVHPSIIRETRRFLSHVDRHGGRVDVQEPRFRLRQCDDTYGAHPEWEQIRDDAQGWLWTLR